MEPVMTRITGASVWEQEMYDYVSDHVAIEAAMLDEYQRLAEDESRSPAFRYLANLILADERRHHQIFNDLAESIRQMGELRLEDEPIPSLHGLRADRIRIMAVTERLLAAERDDAKELKRFAKSLREVRDTTLWGLLVEMMQADTAKHIKILSFIHDRADKAIT
jgi:hypothetical protein